MDHVELAVRCLAKAVQRFIAINCEELRRRVAHAPRLLTVAQERRLMGHHSGLLSYASRRRAKIISLTLYMAVVNVLFRVLAGGIQTHLDPLLVLRRVV